MSEILSVEASMEEKLQELIPEVEILGSKEINFKCNCSREKIVASIATLHEDEIKDMISEDKSFETRCEFCSRVYEITKEDLLQEGSKLYLKENEKVYLKDLLYGLMLPSGCDAADGHFRFGR